MDTKGYHKYLSNGCVTQNIFPDRKFRHQQQRRSQSSFGIFKYHRIFDLLICQKKRGPYLSLQDCYLASHLVTIYSGDEIHSYGKYTITVPGGVKKECTKTPKEQFRCHYALRRHIVKLLYSAELSISSSFFCCLIRQK